MRRDMADEARRGRADREFTLVEIDRRALGKHARGIGARHANADAPRALLDKGGVGKKRRETAPFRFVRLMVENEQPLIRSQRPDRTGQAIEGLAEPIDYINTHGTSTPVGDVPELHAIRKVFGSRIPPFSSTKSLAGHSQGATGVQEAIFSLIMLMKGFIAGSANVETPDPAVGDMPLVTQARAATLRQVLSNSFGFGGTNACLVLRHWG